MVAWEDPQNSASLAADGLPLIAIPLHRRAGADPQRPLRPFANTLVYSDFLSWCPHDRLVYVIDHGGREVTLNDRIGLAGAPRWRTAAPDSPARSAHLSFNSPACAPQHRPPIATAVGPASQDLPFGHEHRSIWLLRAGRWIQIEPTPSGNASDELPLWSTDGQWIAFIRTMLTNLKFALGTGSLYLIHLPINSATPPAVIGPIADIGATGNYYGHDNWAAQIAWHIP